MASGNKNYIYFSRWVTWVNSFKKKVPNPPVDLGDLLMVEYKIDKKSYGIMLRKKKGKLPWSEVGAYLGNDKWKDITKEAEYFGGYYKDFHMKNVKPSDMNEDYEKIAFKIGEDVLHVNKDEVIISKLIKHLPS